MAENFKVIIPKHSLIYQLFEEEDVRDVVRALERVFPKLSPNFPYASYQLLNEMGAYPQGRNRILGRIISFLVDYQFVPLAKAGKRYSSIIYVYTPVHNHGGR